MTETRFTFGGDEHLLAECSESMAMSSFFKSLAVTRQIQQAEIKGITEICPGNASYQIRFDPDVIHPEALLQQVKHFDSTTLADEAAIDTRITEIPVFYQDPWTTETLMRFRERHQNPQQTDLEYAAEINGFDSVEAFITAHHSAPWFVSMVGFVAGVPWLYQMVERERQLQAPKYLRPRTDTPKHTIGHGGCFACIYAVRGAGGYQMFGITPMPIFDPKQQQSYMRESMVYCRPGDIVKFKPIDQAEYEAIEKEVEAGTYAPRCAQVRFELNAFNQDPDRYNASIIEALSHA